MLVGWISRCLYFVWIVAFMAALTVCEYSCVQVLTYVCACVYVDSLVCERWVQRLQEAEASVEGLGKVVAYGAAM